MMNQQQLGDGGIIEPIPITQEDREYLGVIRNRALREWKILAVIASILAVITIIIGVVQISVADIGGAFSFGAPIIVGVMTLLLVLISMCAVCEGRNRRPNGYMFQVFHTFIHGMVLNLLNGRRDNAFVLFYWTVAVF